MYWFENGSDAMRPIVEDLTPPVDLDRDHWRGGALTDLATTSHGAGVTMG
jgi:hypothetical protein